MPDGTAECGCLNPIVCAMLLAGGSKYGYVAAMSAWCVSAVSSVQLKEGMPLRTETAHQAGLKQADLRGSLTETWCPGNVKRLTTALGTLVLQTVSSVFI